MNDLISRKALLEAMQARYERLEKMNQNTPDYADAFTIIDILANELPTIEAVPVVHGEWEVVHGVMTPGGDPLLRCPFCRSEESHHMGGIEFPQHWSFCPNCGARMDGEM